MRDLENQQPIGRVIDFLVHAKYARHVQFTRRALALVDDLPSDLRLVAQLCLTLGAFLVLMVRPVDVRTAIRGIILRCDVLFALVSLIGALRIIFRDDNRLRHRRRFRHEFIHRFSGGVQT